MKSQGLPTFEYCPAVGIPVEVLVGIDRHWQAEEMADETVKAARHPGLETVAALFLAGAGGGVHVSAEVTVVKRGAGRCHGCDQFSACILVSENVPGGNAIFFD